MNIFSSFLITFFIVVILNACGSGTTSSSSSEGETTTDPKETISLSFSGIVIDGLISGADICIDLDSNAVCNDNDAITTTSNKGVFSFSNISVKEESTLSLIAQNGTDSATNKQFNGVLKTILYTSDISPTEYKYVTPLTDLVATRFLSDQVQDYTTLESARELIGNAYVGSKENVGLSPHTDGIIFARTQEIQQTISLLSEALKNKGVVLSTKVLQNNIKFAIVSQLEEDKVLDLSATLAKLESLMDVNFTTENKVLLNSQLDMIKEAINDFSSTSGLTVENLDNYQVTLENEADKIYIAMQEGNTSVIPIDINISAVINPPVVDTNTTEPDDNTTQVVETTELSFTGSIVDGYISGATLCMDLNYDGICSSTEPSTVSNSKGYYAFADVEVTKESMIPIIGAGGEDTSIGKPRSGELKSIVSSQNIGSVYVTPIIDILMSSFATQEIKYLDFVTASNQFSQALGFGSSDLISDPMKSVSYFIISQEIEHIKRILEIVARRNIGGALTVQGSLDLKKSIKKSLHAQILETGYTNLNIESVLVSLEINLNINISNADRTYAIEQSKEVVRVLDKLGSSPDMNTFALNKLQGTLETILTDAYQKVEYTDINITIDMLTDSTFSKTDASYDENACIIKGEYTNVLSDTNASVAFAKDDKFGMIIKSYYGETKMYYPNLDIDTLGANTLVSTNENYYFSFDEAWSTTAKNIYIQTDKNENNKYECYRATLNSIDARDIDIVKVYSYSPL